MFRLKIKMGGLNLSIGVIMNKKYKIGRYTYAEIAMDKFGEPKILRDWEDEEIFTLVDYDGEPVKKKRGKI